jgi:hypothetical protein
VAGVSQTKDAERRDKEERSSREGHAVSAGPVKTFQKRAMSKTHRQPMDEGNLRDFNFKIGRPRLVKPS